MFIFYTLLYIILTYLSYTCMIFLSGVSSVVTLIREGYFAYLFVLVFYKFLTVDKFSIKKNIQNVLLLLCIIIALFYINISPYLSNAITTFILYFSGPILFLLISQLRLSEKTRIRFDFYFSLVMISVCVLNVLFYFIQNKLVSVIPVESLKYFRRSGEKIRYLGIAFHPTITGFFFVYFIGYLFIIKKEYLSSLFSGAFFLLTGTRSAMLGVFIYIFLKLKKTLKIIAFIFGCSILVVVYMLLASNRLNLILDGSALAHLTHLFILGPQTVIDYPLGAGLGTVSPYNSENPIIHLESEMYLYMIQLGFISFILKLSFYIIIIKKLIIRNSGKSNYLLFILFTFLTGCMVFALNDMRFISNFIWIMLGMEFSDAYYNNIFLKKKHKFLNLCFAVAKEGGKQ